MKIDEVAYKVFQHEIDYQTFREAMPEEIAQALLLTKTISKKKSWFPMAIAAAIFGCCVFAVSFSLSFNDMSLRPAVKNITANLPKNPEEKVLSFVHSVQLNRYYRR
jgi:hypothetical protein